MPKTITSVTLNYNKARTQASNLDNIATQLRVNKLKLKSCKSNINTAWKGDNATAYLRKLENVVNNLETIESNIKKIANTVRTNSKRTYNAEVAAINTARKRNYK